jgi:hypothetical protein
MTATLFGGANGTAVGPRPGSARVIAGTAGVLLVAFGIAGFAFTGFDHFFNPSSAKVLWFQVNPAQNALHVLIGIAGIGLARDRRTARWFAHTAMIVFLTVAVYGAAAVGSQRDVLAVNAADNWLHLILALGGVALFAVTKLESYRAAAEDKNNPPRSERPAEGPRQTDDDIATSLPIGGSRKVDTGGRGDVDRAHPYDEEPSSLRMEDLDPPSTWSV